MNCRIEQIPSLSAIYYAFLQSGYEFFSPERDPHFCDVIRGFAGEDPVPSFFSDVRQNTCEVYPYWPRAFILETAVFYMDGDLSGFRDWNGFQKRILSAASISPKEKDAPLWTWAKDLPGALKSVVNSTGFRRYLDWEKEWISGQNSKYRDELQLLDDLLAGCRKTVRPACQHIRIALCPIKCVYSSDHHIVEDSFIFTSGDLRCGSIVHEYLHTVVHPLIGQGVKVPSRRQYPNIDKSYYLDQSEQGDRNAFEEHAVRVLTDMVMKRQQLPYLRTFLAGLAD